MQKKYVIKYWIIAIILILILFVVYVILYYSKRKLATRIKKLEKQREESKSTSSGELL